jgi:hypothetical protein
MKEKSILFVLIPAIALVMLSSCKKDKEDNTPIEEKIEQAYQEIKTAADAVLSSPNPVAEFEAIAEQYRMKEEVKSVEVRDDGMFVKFINDELCGWYIPPTVIVPASKETVASHAVLKKLVSKQSNDGTTAGKSACLLNQQVNDNKDWMDYNEYCLSALYREFHEHNWSVEVVRGKKIDLEFVRRNLKNYDAIYYSAHGCEADGKIWIFTGEKVEKEPVCLPGEVARISLLERDTDSGTVAWNETYAFCGEFIKHYYEKDDFSDACIYMVACQSMGSRGKMNYSMASAFSDYGCGAYVGWYESNCSGQEAGLHLYKQLLNGMTLSETYSYMENFPPENRLAVTHPEWGSNAGAEDLKNMTVDDSYQVNLQWIQNQTHVNIYATYPASTLHYYPSTAGNYTLVDETAKPVPVSGLVAYYPFNGNANDASGNENHGTVTGSNFVTAKAGQGIYFENSNNSYYYDLKDYVTLPSLSLSNFSVAFWAKSYKANTYDNHEASLFSVGDHHDKYFILWCDNNRTGELFFDYNGTVSERINIQDNEWHFIVAVKSFREIALYVDNVKIDSKSVDDYTFLNQPAYFSCHKWGSSNSSRFYGIIDEARIYDRELTAAEIQALYSE